ncbi:uncharacterized protein TNCV_166721 [Trichonephila clavipes]|nr:uncharacterized protein TNCV_166721 [Trichonephila clavipes]
MDVCKCIVPSRHGDTLNSRRAARPLVRLVEREDRWESPDHPWGVLPLKWGGIELNRSVTCMVLKATKHTNAKAELRDFEISSISFFLRERIGEIGNVIEVVFDLTRQTNLKVDNDDVQKLLNIHSRELTMDELIQCSGKTFKTLTTEELKSL